MKVIIAGSRDFNDYNLLRDKCNLLLSDCDVKEIVSGKARGADSLGERYAMEKNYSVAEFPANWTKFGKSAGHKRNAEMANYGDVLIAFWDGKSKGTKSMIDLANKKGLKVYMVIY